MVNLSASDYFMSGQGFYINQEIQLSNTLETPMLYLANPAESGVAVRLSSYYFATDSTQGIVTARVYAVPTVTSPGNAIPIINSYGLNPNVSAINVYALPQVSFNGYKRIGLVTAAQTSPSVFHVQDQVIIPPLGTLLLTLQAANIGLMSNVNVHYNLHWIET